jgi:hypothetical protein
MGGNEMGTNENDKPANFWDLPRDCPLCMARVPNFAVLQEHAETMHKVRLPKPPPDKWAEEILAEIEALRRG